MCPEESSINSESQLNATSASTGIVGETKQTPMNREFGRQEAELTLLYKTIETLEQKLNPVLSPELPKEGVDKEEESLESDVVRVIQTNTNKVRYASQRLQVLVDRITI